MQGWSQRVDATLYLEREMECGLMGHKFHRGFTAAEKTELPGHWEGDLLSGPNNSYIATLVERHTRYVMLAKVAGKDTRTVVTALIKQAKKLPKVAV
jgi:IS30 family transposase